MKKFVETSMLLMAWFFVQGFGVTKAAMTYGNGYYTNLCDSGTSASYYNCNPGCNPVTGVCTGKNQGAVKWICTGKWNQCLESESQWSDSEKIDNVGCGFTEQLSIFDKKCRREDGTWDNTCNLLGYMVWYAGDCRPGFPQPSGMPIVTQTTLPTPSIVVKPTVTAASKLFGYLAALSTKNGVVASPIPSPSPSISSGVSPSPVPVGAMCGKKCTQTVSCSLGFSCVGGVCRNPACPTDKSCFCQGKSTVEGSAGVGGEKTPDTGVETWLGMAGMVVFGVAGVKMRKFSKKVWA